MNKRIAKLALAIALITITLRTPVYAAYDISGDTGYRRAGVTVTTQCVDINHATETELDKLPGVGKTIAGRIVAARPYTSTVGLSAVKGIGSGKLYQRLQTVTCVK